MDELAELPERVRASVVPVIRHMKAGPARENVEAQS